MSPRAVTWLLVPITYVLVRLLSSRSISGAWELGAEALTLIVVVPLAQLVVLDFVRWLRGRGI